MDFAFQLLKQFKPKSIFDMSLVTACIRPSGASYRNDLIAKKIHRNPSSMIDKLLANNLGYLVYQEDIIAFLQQICGLSGSAADTVRRCIAKKQKDKLEKWLPKIIDGYCSKSTKSRKDAEEEARDYLQVIEDASAYSFGYNHSVAYCLIGYICAYLRYYHPGEFVTSLLNNAANESDIAGATELASLYGYKILPPRYGISSDIYGLNTSDKVISKGAASIKEMNADVARSLFEMSQNSGTKSFAKLLCDLHKNKPTDKSQKNKAIKKNQIELLIKVDYFSMFGNISELTRVYELCESFKYGERKQYPVASATGVTRELLSRHASNKTSKGEDAANFKFYSEDDCVEFLCECESYIMSLHLDDIDVKTKIANQQAYLGYVALSSTDPNDKRRLYVSSVRAIKGFRGGVWKYSLETIGMYTGKKSQISVSPVFYKRHEVNEGDIIFIPTGCLAKDRKGYWNATQYSIVG